MKEEFIRAGKKLFEEGLITSWEGSLSIRVQDKIFVTKKDAILPELKEDDIIEIGVEGPAHAEAASDFETHRSIYLNSSYSAIVHAHPAYSIVLGSTEEKILPQDAYGRQLLRTVPVIRVRDSLSNEEVVKFLVPAFKNGCNSAVVRGHGAFSAANTLFDACKLMSALEKSCRIIILSKPASVITEKKEERRTSHFRSAIPPSIGVMDRAYRGKR